MFHLKRLELVNRAVKELADQEETRESVCFQNSVAAIKTKVKLSVFLYNLPGLNNKKCFVHMME